MGRGFRGDRARVARPSGRKAPCSTPRAAPRWKQRSCMGCWRAPTATTICPTARTCATRPRRWRCLKASACRSAPARSTTLPIPTASSFFGQNVGTSSPRMLHQLQEAVKRGVPIVTFNPLRERGLVEFVNPQSPAEMLVKPADADHIAISSAQDWRRYRGHHGHRQGSVRARRERFGRMRTDRVLDHDFIAEHTHGFEEFKPPSKIAPGNRSKAARV